MGMFERLMGALNWLIVIVLCLLVILMVGQPASWDYGVAIALMGCYTLLGKELPAECVVVPGLGVTSDNLEEGWERCFNSPLPTNVKKAMYQKKK